MMPGRMTKITENRVWECLLQSGTFRIECPWPLTKRDRIDIQECLEFFLRGTHITVQEPSNEAVKPE